MDSNRKLGKKVDKAVDFQKCINKRIPSKIEDIKQWLKNFWNSLVNFELIQGNESTMTYTTAWKKVYMDDNEKIIKKIGKSIYKILEQEWPVQQQLEKIN